MRVCPTCHGDGEITHYGPYGVSAVDPCPRCGGTGELEPAGESVAARAERERLLQGVERWPCGCEKGKTPHGVGWGDCEFAGALFNNRERAAPGVAREDEAGE